jgi:hypothetical protein
MTAFVRQVEDLLDEGGRWASGVRFPDLLDPDAPADSPAGGKTDRYLVATAFLAGTIHSWPRPPQCWARTTTRRTSESCTMGCGRRSDASW